MYMYRIAVILITFGITIQNTCPLGLAEKTALASPLHHECPMNSRHCSDSKDGKRSSDMRDIQKYFNTFNLLCTPIGTHAHIVYRAGAPAIAKYISHDDGLTQPPFKPPRSLSALYS